MLGEHHNSLLNEFPEFKEQIHNLKTSDNHFSRLFEEYESVDKEVYRIEEQIENTSDEYLENLKKQRLKLKDQLYSMLKAV